MTKAPVQSPATHVGGGGKGDKLQHLPALAMKGKKRMKCMVKTVRLHSREIFNVAGDIFAFVLLIRIRCGCGLLITTD